MRVTKNIKPDEIIDVNQQGSELTIIKAGNGLRVFGYDARGTKVLETDIFQGDSLSGLNCALLQFQSEISQKIIVWYSNFKYKFEKQTDRVRSVSGYEKPLLPLVNKFLNEDPARVGATVTSDVDIWVGGDDLKSANGIVTGGRKFKAGESFRLNNYGDVYYWATDVTKKVFYSGSTRALYAKDTTRTELEANGVPYFDIYIPPEYDNQEFIITLETARETVGVDGMGTQFIKTRATLIYTVNDETTEQLGIAFAWDSQSRYTGVTRKTEDVAITLSKGTHRIFMSEYQLDPIAETESGHVMYGSSFLTIESVSTFNTAFLVSGYAQVLEERA